MTVGSIEALAIDILAGLIVKLLTSGSSGSGPVQP